MSVGHDTCVQRSGREISISNALDIYIEISRDLITSSSICESKSYIPYVFSISPTLHRIKIKAPVIHTVHPNTNANNYNKLCRSPSLHVTPAILEAIN